MRGIRRAKKDTDVTDSLESYTTQDISPQFTVWTCQSRSIHSAVCMTYIIAAVTCSTSIVLLALTSVTIEVDTTTFSDEQ